MPASAWRQIFLPEESRSGILENEPDLLHSLRRVDRHVDRPEGQDREIDKRPFGAILRDDRDPITAFDAQHRQAEGDTLHTSDRRWP